MSKLKVLVFVAGLALSLEGQAGFLKQPFNADEYESLLEKMIGVSEHLQNHPEKGKIPKERLVADIIMRELDGKIAQNAGAGNLTVLDLDYSSDRSRPNLIFKFHGTNPKKVVTFMGSHMDVVPANPADKEWGGRSPFKLTKERDEKGHRLYGRGVTDCLGHVALLTLFLKRLAEEKTKLEHSIVVVFIANEETSRIQGIGIDEVHRHKHLEDLKQGPVYWPDSADTLTLGPRLGTGGLAQFHFTFKGRTCHSGYPSKGINPITLQSKFISALDQHFCSFFDETATREIGAHYSELSSCKATQVINLPEGSLSQVASECKLGGDIRYTPFWETSRVRLELEDFVLKFNQRVERGEILQGPREFKSQNIEGDMQVGKVELEWQGEPAPGFLANMDGAAYKNAVAALKEVTGKDLLGFAATGSLPLIAEMKDAGFDILPFGFGLQVSYHSPGEFGYLEDFATGYAVVERIVERFEQGI